MKRLDDKTTTASTRTKNIEKKNSENKKKCLWKCVQCIAANFVEVNLHLFFSFRRYEKKNRVKNIPHVTLRLVCWKSKKKKRKKLKLNLKRTTKSVVNRCTQKNGRIINAGIMSVLCLVSKLYFNCKFIQNLVWFLFVWLGCLVVAGFYFCDSHRIGNERKFFSCYIFRVSSHVYLLNVCGKKREGIKWMSSI